MHALLQQYSDAVIDSAMLSARWQQCRVGRHSTFMPVLYLFTPYFDF
jgi:hypothetical protein